MKNFKLKKLLSALAITLVATTTLFPIKASAAWLQSNSGSWSYTEGNQYAYGWKSINSNWYFFDGNGIMKTGWFSNNGSWYYATSSGEMKTGWVNDGGKWYYTASSGAMQTGWLSNNGAWYYLNSSGAMQTGFLNLNDKTYYLDQNGAMKTGEVTVDGVNYAFNSNGEKVTLPNVVAAPTTIAAPISTTTKSDTPKSDTTDTDSTESEDNSGGGSNSKATDKTTTTSTPYYNSLIGTWIIREHIPSTMKETLSTLIRNANLTLEDFKGVKVYIASNSIKVSLYKVSDPKITEGIMTSSEFSSKYNDTLSNLGISGDKVKYINATKGSNYVDIFIADDGNVYTIVKGALFRLEKN